MNRSCIVIDHRSLIALHEKHVPRYITYYIAIHIDDMSLYSIIMIILIYSTYNINVLKVEVENRKLEILHLHLHLHLQYMFILHLDLHQQCRL